MVTKLRKEQVETNNKITSVTIINPHDAYDVDTQTPILLVAENMTISRIDVSLNTTSYEVAGDLKWASDLTSFTGATLINDFDTTSGVRSDSGITSGSVASGKWLYLQFDSQPNAAITFMTITIRWSLD